MRKRKSAHRDTGTTAANKKKFLVALAAGRAPGAAAKKVGVVRSTVYEWRRTDPDFATKWEEAKEVMLDNVETALYEEGVENGNVTAMLAVLRAYRPETWCKEAAQSRPRQLTQNNFFANISLEEQNKRLAQMGLPPVMIESDIEDDNDVANGRA